MANAVPGEKRRYQEKFNSAIIADDLNKNQSFRTTELSKYTRSRQLTESLDLLKKCGFSGDTAIFVLSNFQSLGARAWIFAPTAKVNFGWMSQLTATQELNIYVLAAVILPWGHALTQRSYCDRHAFLRMSDRIWVECLALTGLVVKSRLYSSKLKPKLRQGGQQHETF